MFTLRVTPKLKNKFWKSKYNITLWVTLFSNIFGCIISHSAIKVGRSILKKASWRSKK